MVSGPGSVEHERRRARPSGPEAGRDGRARLRSARVLIVGAGGPGAAVAGQLAADGVGYLGLVDHGAVEQHDPGGWPPHLTAAAGRNKAESVAAHITALTPDVQADVYPVQIEAANAEAIVAGHDLVVECSGHAQTRYLTNDACVALGVALVWGEVSGPSARVGSIRPGKTACYRCAFPEASSNSPHSGRPGLTVPGALAGLVGSIQAAESVKLLVGAGRPLTDRVLEIDVLGGSFTGRRVRPDGRCRACESLEARQEEVG